MHELLRLVFLGPPERAETNRLRRFSSRRISVEVQVEVPGAGHSSVAASSKLNEFADSQFGHCFLWGGTLQIALKELSIRGDFRTTQKYLVTLQETISFMKN
ncbi:acetyl-coa carboxylase [Culex quinquefasciatus]|uniref:Acetyl-coa carboxylase n=1 Tax=Culex quinquefasciatus TaxID=7176 RepID=B0WWR4_CULQU|nr:acetyl-coa carboxylase [Culex quinquefasciatus]|eukprot:XP_001861836.1 acetyl-coa carboxylase [Culex quinquefasciatus]